jgi:dCMP deaminase
MIATRKGTEPGLQAHSGIRHPTSLAANQSPFAAFHAPVEKGMRVGETTGLRSKPVQRPSWDQYFMTITRQVAERSTCTRAKVGAVIVRDRSILATGYNGAPAGLPHCLDAGCLIYESRTPDGELEQNCYRTIHAEINAITQAARNGSAIRDADIYVTHTPCIHCLKVLINTGIKTVHYEKPYKLHTITELLTYAWIKLVQVPAEATDATR